MGLSAAIRSRQRINWSPIPHRFKNDFDLSAMGGDNCPKKAKRLSNELEILQREGAITESVRGPPDWKSLIRQHREVINISLDPTRTKRILLKTKNFVNASLRSAPGNDLKLFRKRSTSAKNKCKNPIELRKSYDIFHPICIPHFSDRREFEQGLSGEGRESNSGARCMGLIVLVIIWLITIASTYFFIAKTWWLPAGASAAAAGIDHHFTTTYILMGIVFVAAQIALGLLAWKYRDGGSSSKAHYSHGNMKLEIVRTVLTTILFVGLNLASSSIWASERFRAVEPNAVRVEVTGMQFAWYFRYPGPDDKFGATNPELEDASAGGEAALGLDTKDPAPKDDVVTGTMVVPVNREIEVILRAHDVIHSLFIPC